MIQKHKMVSIIVPTYNRAALLDLTLKTIDNQQIDRSLMEVIVVDDGSSDNTKQIVDSYRHLLSIKYCFQDDLGYRVASARNLAIQNAEGDIILFVDSGILLHSSFVASHLDSHLKSKNDIAVIGYVLGLQMEHNELAFDIHPSTVNETISRFTTSGMFDDIREKVYAVCDSNLSRLPAPWILFWTGNASVRKSTLLKAGTFDTNFDMRWGIEDVELGYRLYKQNVQFELNRQASAIHYPHYSDSASKLEQERQNKLYMHKKHGSQETLALLESDTVNLNLVLTGQRG